MSENDSVSPVGETQSGESEALEKVMDKATESVAETVKDAVNDSTETPSTLLSKDELIELRKESEQWSPGAVKMLDSYEKLYGELAGAMQKVETYWDGLLRQRAETDNLQKRMQRDVENARKYALERFATELLPVKDSIELGLEAATKPETDLNAIRDGMTLTLKMLITLLEKFNIVEINPQDQKFNPQWHEAMAMQPLPNVEEGTVIHVHQKGYQLNDRLLRPARVIVAKTVEPQQPLENQG